jgi:calcineurin-like phosphoesterase family protein
MTTSTASADSYSLARQPKEHQEEVEDEREREPMNERPSHAQRNNSRWKSYNFYAQIIVLWRSFLKQHNNKQQQQSAVMRGREIKEKNVQEIRCHKRAQRAVKSVTRLS